MTAEEDLEAVDVIGVFVGEEYSIQPIDACTQCLLPEVRPDIDQQTLTLPANPGGNAQPVVPRISGTAGGAPASHHGNSLRSSGSQ